MAKITIKELESLTANDAGRILREGGNLAGRITVRKDGVSVSCWCRRRIDPVTEMSLIQSDSSRTSTCPGFVPI
ncbi:hypothetical protein [Pseudomonas farris]